MSKVIHVKDDVYHVTVKLDNVEYTDTISISGAEQFLLTASANNKSYAITAAMMKAVKDNSNPTEKETQNVQQSKNPPAIKKRKVKY